MTTFDQYTPEERLECIGMWATVDTERFLAVIVRAFPSDDVRYAQMLAPEINDYYTASLESITPRPDLPRANVTTLNLDVADTCTNPIYAPMPSTRQKARSKA